MTRRPNCIIVTGQPGAGKTTLSKRLAERLFLPVISRDEIKEGYVNTLGARHDQLPADTNGVVTDLFFEIVQHYLTGNVSVVIEAAFQHPIWEVRLPHVAEFATPIIIVCSLDSTVAAKRHLQRGLENPDREFYHGDTRVTHYRETGEFLPPSPYRAPELDVPTIQVSTEREYAPTLDELVRQIQKLTF